MCDLDSIAKDGWKKRFPLCPSNQQEEMGKGLCVGLGIALTDREGMIKVCTNIQSL